jgi:endonuclease YncB( thermonuclease family)
MPNSQIFAPSNALAVVDGDTLVVGRQVVRLKGIAAPSRGVACGASDCGAAAANALAAMIRDRGVACVIDGHDAAGRPLGLCEAAGLQLNEALVRDGWARASAVELRAVEADARQAGRGIWRATL